MMSRGRRPEQASACGQGFRGESVLTDGDHLQTGFQLGFDSGPRIHRFETPPQNVKVMMVAERRSKRLHGAKPRTRHMRDILKNQQMMRVGLGPLSLRVSPAAA